MDEQRTRDEGPEPTVEYDDAEHRAGAADTEPVDADSAMDDDAAPIDDGSDAGKAEPRAVDETAEDGSEHGATDIGDIEEVEDVDTLREEVATLKERHLRLAAEFENYRKRVGRERRDVSARSQAEVVGGLLEALDDLQRVAHLDRDSTSVEALLEGVQLVEKKFRQRLEAAGLEPVQAEGEYFNPSVMEALMTVPADAAEEDDQVADVFQQGYRFNGILLRPARVRVKKYEE